jgi:serine phosphatase RsbU (regulator of sigma subunit)
LEAASITQQAILPQRLPTIGGWDLAARYHPVIQVGGDLYDWLRLPNDDWLFYIADATGHGVSAALLTTLTKLVFRHAVGEAQTAAGVINAVNAEFFSIFKGRSFLTAACLIISRERNDVHFAGAGHPPLLVVRRTGGVDLIPGLAPPVGVRAELAGEETAAVVESGDTLLLYTDGLYSQPGQNGGHRAPSELAALLPPAHDSAERFLTETLVRAGIQPNGAALPDDVAAIALRRL